MKSLKVLKMKNKKLIINICIILFTVVINHILWKNEGNESKSHKIFHKSRRRAIIYYFINQQYDRAGNASGNDRICREDENIFRHLFLFTHSFNSSRSFSLNSSSLAKAETKSLMELPKNVSRNLFPSSTPYFSLSTVG